MLVGTLYLFEDCVKLTTWCGGAGDLPGSFLFPSLETQGKLFSGEDIFEKYQAVLTSGTWVSKGVTCMFPD